MNLVTVLLCPKKLDIWIITHCHEDSCRVFINTWNTHLLDTTVLNLVISPITEGGQIHLNFVTVL